ncbi:aryl-alcohol dehydrogenase-like predicted oxidoreductase [Planomicrobium soli]|uniref:Aryl-alcohol dehydrogenase-like predicted oxidoreductase n=1 Tax=Planomicrobium soli TaxID=1176648 RepID=A0A2P8H751_9BACL|nr:aldo/keto reductase [Planomicrobium soli]PSL42020.1 aryl-alcohol dehydrogenase-like predicted oxidoreductase [Planomicrobium soli]
MKTAHLGNSGLRVSEIGFGCMSLPTDSKQAAAIVDEAIASGINYFDTADLYNKGLNEELVGQALKGRRKDIILATKVGNQWHQDSDEVKWNATKPYILEQVHNSLTRLQTDYIDLYQLHGGMITDNAEETIDAFESLKKEGLIREYGISSIRPNVIKRFMEKSAIVSIMMQYSLFDRRPEEWLDSIGSAGTSVVTRGTLAKGLLTNEGPKRAKKMGGYLTYSESEVKDSLKNLMDIHDNLHALSLHSVLQNSTVASVVAGASSPKQIKDTIAAYETSVSIDQINEAKKATKQDVYKEHRE